MLRFRGNQINKRADPNHPQALASKGSPPGTTYVVMQKGHTPLDTVYSWQFESLNLRIHDAGLKSLFLHNMRSLYITLQNACFTVAVSLSTRMNIK